MNTTHPRSTPTTARAATAQPRSTKRLRIVGIGVTLALVAIVLVAAWFLFFRDDAPPPVSMEGALSDSENVSATPGSLTVSGATTSDGTWVLAADSESFVGYRVAEELVSIGTTEAVGRTSAITASVQLTGTTVSATEINADLAQLASDSSRRDGALRGQALETDAFPTATFVLTTPIDLGETPVEDTTYVSEAVGDLTLHGVTRSVAIPIEARFSDGFLVVIGTADITFADYEIDPPSSQSVLSVEDHGTLELQLILARSTTGS